MALSRQQHAKLNTQLDRWQQDLVNLTKRNKLLFFKHTKTSSLEITAPAMSKIPSRLDGTGWSFFMPPVDGDPDASGSPRPRLTHEIETTKRSGKEVLASLRSLERTSNQTMLDTGLWVLYLAYGMLTWTDPTDSKVCESPLLLQPVVLTRPGLPTDFTLTAADEDPVINPALTIKLANDFGIALPALDDLEGDPRSVVDAVRRAVSKEKSWRVDERVVLTTFTFHKEAMYRDLLANREAIGKHPLIRIAAIGPDAGAERFSFSPPSDDELDSTASPEALVSIRDADSTQRKCIIAARNGRSFVMDGPPGTGKSQTITNIIAELLHAGRSVLFVSEKAAALEVVSNRLNDAGLSEFVLELHSHKATRKEVATELGRSLEVSPRASVGFSETERANLVRLRQELNGYTVGLNVNREPLGQSLFQVLGRILQLQHLPQAPLASAVDLSLTAETLDRTLGAAARLGGAWRPVLEGDSYLWRSMRFETYSAGRQQEVRRLLTECVASIDALLPQLEDVDARLGLGWTADLKQAERLRGLVAAVEAHPGRHELPGHWLTLNSLEPIDTLINVKNEQVNRLSELQGIADRLASGSWRNVPTGLSQGTREAMAALASEQTRISIDEFTFSESLVECSQLLSEVGKRVEEMENSAGAIAAAFGLAPRERTLRRFGQLAGLTSLVGSPTPPEPAWLNQFAQAALAEAITVLKELVRDYRLRKESLSDTFTEDILNLDPAGLRNRFAAASGLRKLSGTYRADKKTLSTCTVGGKVTAAVIKRLDEAALWSELRSRLSRSEETHAALLGTYYRGPVNTDLERLDRAVNVAQRAIELCSGPVPTEVAGQLALGAQPSLDAADAGPRLKAAIDSWRAQIEPRLRAFGIRDEDPALDDLAAWSLRARPLVDHLAAVTGDASRAIGARIPVGELLRLLEVVDQIAVAETELASTSEEDAALLGPTWNGQLTDFDKLRRDLAWARTVVAAAGGPVSEPVSSELIALEDSAGILSGRISAVAKTWGPIADLFIPPWRDQLSADFTVSFDAGRALLGELLETTGDIEEWTRFAAARQELIDDGVADVLEYLEREAVAAEQVDGIIERSILESWAESVISTDIRLRTLNPADRDKIVDRFRQLDRALVANSAAAVINACAARRPSTALGAAGTIRREAQKKTRHKPIRTLLEETKEVSLALKPCFMMSPLSVSQFLPPNVDFDVVIFDEASQVKPSDAVNCIYRGRQLIVAGDPRQLPPTSFFDQVSEEGADELDDEAPEDFESVLDIFLGSGLPPLSLQWHYRSQHESLITYSNYRFYDGRLHTFPGAIESASDVGIELIRADGVYRRGGARDNPIEATKVVERVLFHRRKHPDLTLGVVAFSSAQESAIVAELERQSGEVPELVELLSDADRLDGFFVKNLENVQGDERDIILFSIGYGPDENGKFTEQLGPLGQKGGERRLNVAITRARRRIEVISSVTSANFPGTSAAPGIRHLQRYLDFADRGVTAMALDIAAGGDAESVFEEMVIKFLQSLGYTPVPQVGVAGYRIDIGVRHPKRPGEYVLGIECDGAAYHSSRVARDRDRLRQEILENLGWRLHRIWGPSWFRDRHGQEAILRDVLEKAIKGKSPEPRTRPAPAVAPIVELDPVDLNAQPDWSIVYAPSNWTPRGGVAASDVHAVPAGTLSAAVDRIVKDEGPVHGDVLRRRLADAYGVRRIGDRIKAALDAGISLALRQKSIERVDKEFFLVPGAPLRVRTAGDDERTQRLVSHVAPVERQSAIEQLVSESRRVDKNDLKVAFGRLFGWRRVGTDIEAAFERDLAALVKAGRVRLEGTETVVAP